MRTRNIENSVIKYLFVQNYLHNRISTELTQLAVDMSPHLAKYSDSQFGQSLLYLINVVCGGEKHQTQI